MKKLLWSPPKDRINNSNLKKFIKFVKLENCNDFKTLWKWSISNPKKFWSKFWDFSEIIGEKGNQILKMDSNSAWTTAIYIYCYIDRFRQFT